LGPETFIELIDPWIIFKIKERFVKFLRTVKLSKPANLPWYQYPD